MKIGLRLLYAAFFVLLVASIVASQEMRADAGEVAERARDIKPVKTGENVSRMETRLDIHDSSLTNFQALPVPAVYVIDESGRVTYSFVEADYKVRLPAEDLMRATEAMTD